ncbi:MAG: DUF421 domain-containing protein [Clostridium sp.]
MQEYINLMVKSFIFYFVIIFALRLMGKREVGELSVFDIVIYFVMSELLAISISNEDESIFKSLVPIFTLAFLQMLISWLILKSKKIRSVFDGEISILIHNGHINQDVMRKERYNIDDLMSQIRSKDLCSPEEVGFAILETNGQLSILPKNKCKVKHPNPLISDGTVDKKALEDLSLDEEWLKKALLKEGIDNIKDVFLCIYQKNGLFVIKKEIKTRNVLFHKDEKPGTSE